jgi:probable rRNA maturation factor
MSLSTAMTPTTETASAEQDESGCPSSAEADIPPEPAREPDQPESKIDPGAVDIAVMTGVNVHIDGTWLRRKLLAALELIDRPVGRVSLRIVADQAMTELHRRHKGIDATTDVLTFAEEGEAIDADIAVCADEAARQAAGRGHPVDSELLLYALHGVLHCDRFDDRDDAGSRAMHAEEDRILRAIGVGATFARGASGHDDRPGDSHRDTDARA